MLLVTTVSNKDELLQIHQLSQENLKQNLSAGERAVEGFVTWLYSVDLLEQMHQLAPSVIVKDGDKVVGYALTTLREARAFHPDLETLFRNLEAVQYKGQALASYSFYCMGQICVAKAYRGKGMVDSLYQKHKEIYSGQFDFILTEISIRNPRSMRAHQKIGFQTIYTHTDDMDEWDVVVWDWK
jgi:hypothetical protein